MYNLISSQIKPADHTKLVTEFLRKIVTPFESPWRYVFNRSIKNDNYPVLWEIANVLPSFKMDDKSFSSNYKPVTEI
jgi:hypothetical protein